jgi:hypothetical protein
MVELHGIPILAFGEEDSGEALLLGLSQERPSLLLVNLNIM